MADSDHSTTLSVSRRHLLAGAGALALTVPAALATPGMGDDAHLVRLWRRLLDAYAAQRALDDREGGAVLRLPAWAQWGGRDERGIAISQPEWTDAMLREHAIPPEIGRRPNRGDIEALNRDLLDAARARLLPHGAPCPSDGPLADALPHPDMVAVDEANARRRAAFDRRLAEQHAEKELAGLLAVEEEQERVGELISAIVQVILDAEPSTLAGMTIKLRAWRLGTLDWGYRDRADADESEECVLSVLDGMEAALPPVIAEAIPPMLLRKWDRPDAKQIASAAMRIQGAN
jgi:hypothetical protein